MNKPIRVVICTRHTLFREGIKALLSRGFPIEVAGEAATTAAAIKLLELLRPDVVLMDPNAQEINGSEATRLIKAAYPQVKVLLLSLEADEFVMSKCMHAGASGYLANYDGSRQLENAIHGLCERTMNVA